VSWPKTWCRALFPGPTPLCRRIFLDPLAPRSLRPRDLGPCTGKPVSGAQMGSCGVTEEARTSRTLHADWAPGRSRLRWRTRRAQGRTRTHPGEVTAPLHTKSSGQDRTYFRAGDNAHAHTPRLAKVRSTAGFQSSF
jgi:hypothetical protein